jgi:uncharacterized protein with PIN domain
MKFFIDNNLSPQLAKGMAGFGEDVVHLTDHFSPDAKDEDWLRTVGTNGWILITRDERIRWRPVESEALKKYRVAAFFLGGKNRTRCQLIQQLVRNWDRFKEVTAKEHRPFAFRVRPNGRKLDPIDLS